MSLRIVVGCDDAGLQYKDILVHDLEADERVTSVVDVGVGPTSTPPIPTWPSPPRAWSPAGRQTAHS